VRSPIIRFAARQGSKDDSSELLVSDMRVRLPAYLPGTGAVEVPILPTIDAGRGYPWDPISILRGRQLSQPHSLGAIANAQPLMHLPKPLCEFR
jgi:hypothetical protein